MFYLENITFSCSPDKCEFETLLDAHKHTTELLEFRLSDTGMFNAIKDLQDRYPDTNHIMYDKVFGMKYCELYEEHVIYEVDKIPRPTKKIGCMHYYWTVRYYENGLITLIDSCTSVNPDYEALL